MSILSIPPELSSPILKYAIEDQGNLEHRLVCEQFKNVIDLHVIPYLWEKLKKNAGSITAIDLKTRIDQIEATLSFKISLVAFRTLYQKIGPKEPFKYIPVVLSQFLEIQAKLLDESLEIIWPKIQDSLSNSNGIKSAQAIKSYIDNSENAEALQGITRLSLSSLKLKAIPPEIGKFEKVQSINLSNNELSRFPTLSLTKLQTLNLSHNELASCGNLKCLVKLIDLNLSNNQLSNFPDWSTLSKLACLNLSHNKITSFQNLESVTRLPAVLDFFNNPITNLQGIEHLTRLGGLLLRWIPEQK